MLFKSAYRQYRAQLARKKASSVCSTESDCSDSSSARTDSSGERQSQYLDFAKVTQIQRELDNLTQHINALHRSVAQLKETGAHCFETTYQSSIARAYEIERNDLSIREFNEPFKTF